MKAMVYTGPQTLEYQDVPEPTVGTGEVIVEVAASGICGSEIHGIRHADPFRVPPLIMGHEFSGIRTDTGEQVVVNPLVSCGLCDLCLVGRSNICRNRVILGIQRPGGFAERVAVPIRNLHTATPGLDARQGSLAEPLANAVHAWRAVASLEPDRVGIIGAGSAGLAMVMALRSFGVPRVDVADHSAERADVAVKLGADRVFRDLEEEYDLVIDAVGKSATRRSALERIRPGGVALWLGLEEPDADVDVRAAIRSEKSIRTSFCYTDADFGAAVRIAATVDASWVELRALSEGAETFYELMSGRTDLTKIALRP